jgi:hypothetical protein
MGAPVATVPDKVLLEAGGDVVLLSKESELVVLPPPQAAINRSVIESVKRFICNFQNNKNIQNSQ